VTRVRPSAVAGRFYERRLADLRAEVEGFLAAARAEGPAPKALILPHAGYEYSGPVAASGYAYLASARDAIERVVLLGPAHWHAVDGLAASDAEGFETPLGVVPVDRKAVEDLVAEGLARVDEEAHRREHSLEVHLPFLQVVLDAFRVVPLVTGRTNAEEVARVLDRLWGGPETVVVVSSDLSHYLPYREARVVDERTSQAIAALDAGGVHSDGACGAAGVRGLLTLARRKGMEARILDVRNSGDTAGGRSEVVGYGAYAFAEREPD
jgi:AmmeMemoRadiSam system protein B